MDQDHIRAYYASGIEEYRLSQVHFKLEGIRTKKIIERYLPESSCSIVDIGGGAGFYSFWLKDKGHHVSLVDFSPVNIKIASEINESSSFKLKSLEFGDARNLSFDDCQFDMALMFGPLYHLTKKEDRIRALKEASRVLKPGGLLICAAISRYASLIDGFQRNLIMDPEFMKILSGDLNNGQHRNHTSNMEYFTSAFFHMPAELRDEIMLGGLSFLKLVAVQSFGWTIQNLEQKMNDPHFVQIFNDVLDKVEEDQDLMVMSPHFLGVGRKE